LPPKTHQINIRSFEPSHKYKCDVHSAPLKTSGSGFPFKSFRNDTPVLAHSISQIIHPRGSFSPFKALTHSALPKIKQQSRILPGKASQDPPLLTQPRGVEFHRLADVPTLTTFHDDIDNLSHREEGLTKSKPYIMPLLKKASRKDSPTTSLDLSHSSLEHGGLGIIATCEKGRQSNSVADLANRKNIPGLHHRSTSGTSQFSSASSSSMNKPGSQNIHLMRQATRSYTPPLSQSHQASVFESDASGNRDSVEGELLGWSGSDTFYPSVQGCRVHTPNGRTSKLEGAPPRTSLIMVYDWDGKRDICYQMYIKDKKALEEIMEYMKNVYQFAPSQRDMLRILNEEGFEIKERELMRSTMQASAQLSEDEGLLALQQEVYKNESSFNDTEPLLTDTASPRPPSPGLSPEVLAKRKERLERLKAESAERWATRKRRRRTRGWAGLPADPPGPPRFPSETTIDESKKHLNLDNVMYRQIRDQFQKICEDAGFIKKTVAGPEKWQEAKNKLIQESQHLQHIFWEDPNQLDAKALALDVVCTDVTKRMRTLERRMTIAEAKNALGVNPEESRQIRNAFYNTLKADHFTSKLEAGDEHWTKLKEQWIQNSELLQHILAPGPTDTEHTTKLKALEVLCRDVMKRLRDDQTKRDPARKHSSPQEHTHCPDLGSSHIGNAFSGSITNGISTLASQALASAPVASSDLGDLQIDPSLLQAANDPSFATVDHQDSGHTFGYVDPLLEPSTMQILVYLRIHAQSSLHGDSKPWIEKLTTRSVAELRQLVNTRYPDTFITKIEGTDKDENGHEISFVIDEDHEFDAYLTHMQGRKASFLFSLEQV
ncbi:hypothetical protein ANOM_001786, partial [Aspergillus nomiae NRRL 13137]